MDKYNNYHKHDDMSNIFVIDTNAKIEDYVNRALELQHDNVFTTNHGSGGDIFRCRSACDKNNLHCKFGIEGYIVPDNNPELKDNRNYHIVIIPKTNQARKKLNIISTNANKYGYYYKPRLSLKEIINNLDKNDVYITTACMAGLLRDEDSINQIFYPLYEKFGQNLFIEIQNHNNDLQKAINEKALKYSKELNLKLIAANDSHYIYPQDSHDRITLLEGKNIKYSDENEFILDYPDYNTFVDRFKKQGIFTDLQIFDAIDRTLVFDECEDININKEIKMPDIHKDKNDNEKITLLKNIINENYKRIQKEEDITEENKSKYFKEIRKEMQVIEDTNEIHSVSYFLLNYKLFDLAINKYGGILTRTGRGSCGSFLINKMLGLTQIDPYNTTLPLYSERFASKERLLENRSLPDFDANIVDQEPFIKASKELLGDKGCYSMIAYGTMQQKEAFRNICRSNEEYYEKYNKVCQNLEVYKNDEKWGKYIDESEKYINTIISMSPHPCSFLLYDGDIEEEIGLVKIGDVYCALITSGEADEWKYLKNDYLVVSVWDIIYETFKEIEQPIFTIKQLLNNLDDKTWKLFEDGITCTLNQVDSDWASSLVQRYKPKTPEELAMFVGAIRPNFAPMRDDFINRRPYTTGSEILDKIFAPTENRIIFQENLMQYFEFLEITPAESILLIKKISKKKIKQEDFDKLTERVKNSWIKKTGSIDGFDKSWEEIQSQINYGFNTPHALAVAYDCLYCAYLKSHYPLEYYTVTLNLYKNDIEKTRKLTEELSYFDIKLMPIVFGHSKAEYSYSNEYRQIYKGVSSIKYLNADVGNQLYEISKKEHDDFIDVLYDIQENTHLNTKQLDILIKLNYFNEYGNINYLLALARYFEELSSCKNLKVIKATEYKVSSKIMEHFCDKFTDKTYMGIHNKELLEFISQHIHVNEATPYDLMRYQNSYLSYISETNKDVEMNTFMVTDIYVTSYGQPYVTLYRVYDGYTHEYKIDKIWYRRNKVETGNVLKCIFMNKDKWEKIGEEFIKTGEQEVIIKLYEIIDNKTIK